MRFFRCAALAAALILPALRAGADEEDEPFAEEQQRAEFKEVETKAEMGRIEPRAVVAPGPEGGANPQLFRDRLQVLRHERAAAVREKRPAAEIARIDARIKEVERQLAPYGR